MLWRDREHLEQSSRQAAQYCHLGGQFGVCRVLTKFKVYLNTRDMSLGPHLMMEGFWESWITLCVSKIIKPGWRCIDVGANFGYYTMLMAELVGPEGDVIACEADQDIAACLRKTVMINGFHETVDVITNTAIWNGSNEEVQFFKPMDYMGGGQVGEPEHDFPGASVTLPTVALDMLCAEKVDFVKIDAEGAEYHIIQGMKRLIEDNPKILILMEWTPGANRMDVEFFEEMRNLHEFDILQVLTDGSLCRVNEPPDELVMLLMGRGLVKK